MSLIVEDLNALVTCHQPSTLTPGPFSTMLAIALPHFLYAFIWFRPQAWMKLFPKNPVDMFATWGLIGKVIQFAFVLLWFSTIRPAGLCLDLQTISLLQWLAFLLLVAYGQSLNVGIFQAIGHDGVYYGFKLGKKIPWVSGWPFDAVSHPQYVGSVLTIWGLVALVWGQAPAAALIIMAGFWMCVYVLTALHEQYM